MQELTRASAPPQRHHQRIADQVRRHLSPHRPADDAAREEIEHNCDVKPALQRPDIGEVGHPSPVRRRRMELPVENVACQF